MVEKVAKAIMLARHDGGCNVTDWAAEARENSHVAQALWQARAAIEAMREPTERMVHVLGNAAKYGTRSNGEVGPNEFMSEIIDAALKD